MFVLYNRDNDVSMLIYSTEDIINALGSAKIKDYITQLKTIICLYS